MHASDFWYSNWGETDDEEHHVETLTADAIRALTVPDIEQAIKVPQHNWAHQCHAISLAAVTSGILGASRVARGSAHGVLGQHSWAVLGDDCYDEKAVIVDLTLWSYVPEAPVVYVSEAPHAYRHTPHGAGSILFWDGLPDGSGAHLPLTPETPLSDEAKEFLDGLGAMDVRRWMTLASLAPVGDWPAAEIITAMHQTSGLGGLVPVDRLGMLTDLNPGGLYLASKSEEN